MAFDQFRFDALCDADRYVQAEAMIRRALEAEPHSHWLMARLAFLCTRDGRAKEALRVLERALRIEPRCPLVRWEHGSTLQALGRHADAIAVYRGITRQPLHDLAFGTCGEGLRWARSLRLDCLFFIGECYAELGRPALARRWFLKHLDERCRGIPTMVSKREVVRVLRKKLG